MTSLHDATMTSLCEATMTSLHDAMMTSLCDAVGAAVRCVYDTLGGLVAGAFLLYAAILLVRTGLLRGLWATPTRSARIASL